MKLSYSDTFACRSSRDAQGLNLSGSPPSMNLGDALATQHTIGFRCVQAYRTEAKIAWQDAASGGPGTTDWLQDLSLARSLAVAMINLTSNCPV
jgi:hypothetical protein